MKKILIVLILFYSGVANAQIRAFDNSKSVVPWLYNPAADFSKEFQAIFGYDGRGENTYTPQSILAGARLPIGQDRKSRRRPHSVKGMAGIHAMSTSQDIVRDQTVNFNFAQQVTVNRRMKMALGLGAGINRLSYNSDALVYFDQDDQLLNSGDQFYTMQLNAGFSLVMDDKLFINFAMPYLLKNNGFNVTEAMLRVGYNILFNEDVKLTLAANADTYNRNLIYGGDVKLEMRKMVSVVAGADRYKFHGGVLVDVKPITLGYTYGQNFNNEVENFATHQIVLVTSFSLRGF